MVDPFGHKNQAQNYAKFRPAYPLELIQKVFGSIKGSRRVAIDIGCGTGFLTAHIANSGFQKVFGSDISQKQLDEAKKQYSEYTNLEFKLSKVEQLPEFLQENNIAKENLDLVTIAQAWHWMNYKESLQNLQRLMSSQGRVMILGYAQNRISTPNQLERIKQVASENNFEYFESEN